MSRITIFIFGIILGLIIGFIFKPTSNKPENSNIPPKIIYAQSTPSTNLSSTMAAHRLEEFLAYQSVGYWRDGITKELFATRPIEEILFLCKKYSNNDNKSVLNGLHGVLRGIIRLSNDIQQRQAAIELYLSTCFNYDDRSVADDEIASLASKPLSSYDFNLSTSIKIREQLSSDKFLISSKVISSEKYPSLFLLTPFIQLENTENLRHFLFQNNDLPNKFDRTLPLSIFNKVLALARCGDKTALELFSGWVSESDAGESPIVRCMTYVGNSVSVDLAKKLFFQNKQRLNPPGSDMIQYNDDRLVLPVLIRWVDKFPITDKDTNWSNAFSMKQILLARKWLEDNQHNIKCLDIPNDAGRPF